MKRSEMLKLIENILEANGYCGDTTSSDEMASILLRETETHYEYEWEAES